MITHWSRNARLPLLIALAASGLLVNALPGTTLARAVPAARPADGGSGISTPPGGGAGATTAPGGVCSKNASGQVVNCPKPVTSAQLPALARSTSLVTGPITDPATYLDTRTWTSGGGNTYPGAQWPFGMTQWSPDTSPGRSDGGGYTYGNTRLLGYALTHVSGPGCLSAGDLPILPMTGTSLGTNPSNVTTAFTNRGEVAQAGYYSARSNGPNTITSQFSATPHSAIGRFTFPRTTAADFLIKLRDSERGDSASGATIVGNDEVHGFATSGGFCNESKGHGFGRQDYTVHFDIVFNRPFTRHKIITQPGRKDPNSVFLTFNTTANRLIDAKVAISYVSAADARLNWQGEDPGWNFNPIKTAAQAAWNALLTKISVWGGTTAHTQEFYSLLYKDLLQPNIVSDVNGQFLGSDYKAHALATGQQNQYGMFSGWDLYHSEAQLVAMLDPAAASDMAQSLVNEYAENAILPQWGYLNSDNYTMVGDPADAIIADYYAFGARNFDTATALTDMLAQADHVDTVRPGEALEAADGYLPQTTTTSPDSTYGCCRLHDQVSALLEYDNADFALSQFASAMGDTTDAATLLARANNWANELDANSASPVGSLLTPRCASGRFLTVTPTTGRNVYVEGDAYQYLWDVPNDYADLFADLGGNAVVAPALNAYFTKPNGGGIHAQMANEFDEGEQFALDYASDPAGTQLAVNTIRNTLYPPGPFGLRNNDDLGAESSQFIWEMLGMYPENPGTDNLVLASPGFPHGVIALPNGNTITISAPGASPSKFYASDLQINGSEAAALSVPLSTLSAQDSTMDWTMSASPTTWGQALTPPPSYGPAPTPPAASTSVTSC